ncbi:MAG: hypothetical protein H6738_16685 [Alphaproteobacteria bacterium]|nr:hypothetical protein [Alphaproteobacteria bacterium]MCB9698419.1 hypothetical protein [Alphaproteobacteria bacterium]
MDPLTMGIAGAVLIGLLVIGASVTWWMIRTTVNMVKRMIALAFAMAIAGALLLVALAAFVYQ